MLFNTTKDKFFFFFHKFVTQIHSNLNTNHIDNDDRKHTFNPFASFFS